MCLFVSHHKLCSVVSVLPVTVSCRRPILSLGLITSIGTYCTVLTPIPSQPCVNHPGLFLPSPMCLTAPVSFNWLRSKAAHWSVICQAVDGHVRRSLSSGWSLPHLKGPHDPDMSMQVRGEVRPHGGTACDGTAVPTLVLFVSVFHCYFHQRTFPYRGFPIILASTQEGSRNKKVRAGYPVILYHKALDFWPVRMMANAREGQAGNAYILIFPPEITSRLTAS